MGCYIEEKVDITPSLLTPDPAAEEVDVTFVEGFEVPFDRFDFARRQAYFGFSGHVVL